MPTTPIPPLSLLLAFGPALVQLLLGVAAWLLPTDYRLYALGLGQLWGVAILFFLAGVRRGLSFFTEGGPRPIQIVTMGWLFLLALAGSVLPATLAFVALIVGYLSIALLDPPAARRGETPAYFATLRPPQMVVFLIGLALLAAMSRMVSAH